MDNHHVHRAKRVACDTNLPDGCLSGVKNCATPNVSWIENSLEVHGGLKLSLDVGPSVPAPRSAEAHSPQSWCAP